MSKRRQQQFVGFLISTSELAEFLKLPRDHRIVRIEKPKECDPPGLILIVEGPGGFLTPRHAAACFSDYERWRDTEVDLMREHSIKELGQYEW